MSAGQVSNDDPVYLAVLSWPEGMDRRGRQRLLVEALGLQPYEAGQRAACDRGVIARTDVIGAREAMRIFRRSGMRALAAPAAALAAVNPPMLAKRLHRPGGPGGGEFACEFWRSTPAGFRTKDVGLLVRGRVHKTTRRSEVDTSPNLGMVGYRAGGIEGALIGSAMDANSVNASRQMRRDTSDIVDLYLFAGGRVRINGDKFNFDILGSSKGYTDLENIEKLTLLLAEAAPQAAIDIGFRHFRVPPEVQRERSWSARGTTMRTADESAAFDFYSALMFLRYRGKWVRSARQ